MAIGVTCPSCNRQFNAPDSAAGKNAKCPQCGGAIQIPAGAADDEILEAEEAPPAAAVGDAAAPAAAVAAGDERKPCPMCGEMIQRDAIKCRFCGEVFDATLAKAGQHWGANPAFGETVEQAAKRLNKEKQDRTTAIQLFVLSLIGCFAPILAIYGVVFLVRRPYPFKYKTLAIIGTVLQWFWTVIWIIGFTVGQVNHR